MKFANIDAKNKDICGNQFGIINVTNKFYTKKSKISKYNKVSLGHVKVVTLITCVCVVCVQLLIIYV